MRIRIVHIFILAFITILLVNAFPVDVFAQSMGTNAYGTTFGCQTVMVKGKLSQNIVKCVEKIVNDSVDGVLKDVFAMFFDIVAALVVVSIMLFAIKPMFAGVRNIGIPTNFAIKLFLVAAFMGPASANYLESFRDSILGFSKQFSYKVFVVSNLASGPIAGADPVAVANMDLKDLQILAPDGVTIGAGDLSSLAAGVTQMVAGTKSASEVMEEFISGFTVDLVKEPYAIFGALDDTLFEILGVETFVDESTGATSTDPVKFLVGLAVVIIGLSSAGSIGTLGISFFVAFIAVLVLAIAQFIFFYLSAIIAINFLLLLTPLIMVTILFEKTKRIPRLWLHSILTYAIQPIIMLIFLGLATGMLTSVKYQYKDFYSTVRHNLGNAVNNVDLSDCVKKGISNASNPIEGVRNIKSFGLNFGGAGMGFANSAAINSQLDCINSKVKLKVVRTEETNLLNYTSDDITDLDVKKISGINLGMLIIFVLLISWVRKMDNFIGQLIGQFVVADIGAPAARATNMMNNFVLGGDDNEKGIPGFLRRNVTKQSKR